MKEHSTDTASYITCLCIKKTRFTDSRSTTFIGKLHLRHVNPYKYFFKKPYDGSFWYKSFKLETEDSEEKKTFFSLCFMVLWNSRILVFLFARIST